MSALRRSMPLLLCALLPLLYLLHLQADSVSGLFGIIWSDEGAYLLAARNQVLYGAAHLFAGDRYYPEFTAPLLHRYALLVITKANTVWGVRAGMAVCVMLGAAIFAHIAARYHHDRRAGYLCFAVILLNPILFFYARIGLSEGLQFLLMALICWTLYALYQATAPRRILLYSMLIAALIALMLLAKITAIVGCAGLTIAALATMARHPHFIRNTACAALGGMATLATLFLVWFHGDFAHWYANNFGNYVYGEMVPQNLPQAWEYVRKHYIGLHHFLSLMPITMLGFTGLVIAADRSRGFLWILWLATITMLLGESFLSGELRRSFFGLAMLAVLAGFTVGDFLIRGATGPKSAAHNLAWAVIALYALGWLFFMLSAGVRHDGIYLLFGCSYALLAANLFFLRGERSARARGLLVGLLAVTALIPMLYQTLFAPRSVEQAIAMMEKKIPANTPVTGMMLPWYFQAMQRPMVFTNCREEKWAMANDIEEVPAEFTRFFVTHPKMVSELDCNPPGFDHYRPILRFSIFHPLNKGINFGGSHQWRMVQGFVVYERPGP